MTINLKHSHISHSLGESFLHVSIWVLGVIKILHSLYKTSKDDINIKNYVQNGWSIFSRKQDKSDTEWIYWKEMIFGNLWMWFILHVFVVQIMRRLHANKMKKYVFITFSITFLVATLGPILTSFYLMQIALVCLVGYISTSHLAIWSVSVTFLLFLVVPRIKHFLTSFGLFYAHGDIRFYFQEYLLTMGLLRFTESALYIANDKKDDAFLYHSIMKTQQDVISDSFMRKKNVYFKWKVMDILCYNLYFPLSIFGPLISFEDFLYQFSQEQQVYSNETFEKIKKAVMKSIFWFFTVEICNHFFYHNAFINNPHLLNHISLWSLAGVGYMTGQMFMVKYFVLWTSISAVTLLDGIQTPRVPCCISRIYLYSDMWKMFDRGLYEFLKRHIYIPIGGNEQGKIRHQVASFTSFAFVLLWHGVSNAITIWVVVNVISLFFEEALLINTFMTQKLNLSRAWSRRVHSMVNIPILGLSTFGIFVFLGGFESASIISYRILTEELPRSIVLLGIIAYSMIQTGKDYENYLRAKELHQPNDN